MVQRICWAVLFSACGFVLSACGEFRSEISEKKIGKNLVVIDSKVSSVACRPKQNPCEIITGNQITKMYYNALGKLERSETSGFGPIKTIDYSYNSKGLIDKMLTTSSISRMLQEYYYFENGDRYGMDQDFENDGIVDCKERITKKKEFDKQEIVTQNECIVDGKRSMRMNKVQENYKTIGDKSELISSTSKIVVDELEQSTSQNIYSRELTANGETVETIIQTYGNNQKRILKNVTNRRRELVRTSMDEKGDGKVDVSVEIERDECGNITRQIQKEYLGENEAREIVDKYRYVCD